MENPLFLSIQEGAAWAPEDTINKNFYYACIYDILKDRGHPMEKTLTLNHLKAKTVRIHSKRVQSITKGTHEATLLQGESPSPFICYKCGNAVSPTQPDVPGWSDNGTTEV